MQIEQTQIKFPCTRVREREYKLDHYISHNPPCEWSKAQGATHSLNCEVEQRMGWAGTRPAKLLKTILWVGLDEENGQIIWTKWHIRQIDHHA
jgi:hypothetical protein